MAGDRVAPTPIEVVLRQQLEDARAEASKARAEVTFLTEERDFYMSEHLALRPPRAHAPTARLR